MSLTDRVREARDKAATSLDPTDHALAAALTAAEAEQAREQLTGVGDVDPADYQGGTEFPRWSEVTEPGTVEHYGPPTNINTSALRPRE